jgi:energy-converting hydrogenase Eha subunit B
VARPRLSNLSPSRLIQRAVAGLLGALGVVALVRLVPRLLGFAARRYVLGLLGEIATVALVALVSKKTAERFGKSD